MNSENPLVTFTLMSYNHQRYIREALAGALAQDYSPLEILISDDCSTDETFEIIQEMVTAYRGPHQIKVNRNSENLGIGRHVRRIFELASGEILVLAGGDDISKPDRTRKIVNAFRSNPRAMAVLSNHSSIGDTGRLLEESAGRFSDYKMYLVSEINLALVCSDGGGFGKGAAYAYRKEVALWPEPFPDDVISEDRLLPLRALCLGEIPYLSDILLDYRLSESGLTRTLPWSELMACARPSHMQHVYRTLEAARRERKINRLQHWYLKTICKIAETKWGAVRRGDDSKIKRLPYSVVLRLMVIFYQLITRPLSFFKSSNR
jgi:glycosyltransferase involved in cell wall biosynthesis